MKSGDSNQTADLTIWISLSTTVVKSAACISIRCCLHLTETANGLDLALQKASAIPLKT